MVFHGLPRISMATSLVRYLLACFLGVLFCTIPVEQAGARVSLLIPAKPDIFPSQKEKKTPPPKTKKEKTSQKKQNIQDTNEEVLSVPPPTTNSTRQDIPKEADIFPEPPGINEEIDVLITMMDPYAHKGYPMDIPQAFAVLRYNATNPQDNGHVRPVRLDLLGDVEEILYMGQKAWGANVGLKHPGLYQFIMETRPWWDQEQNRFLQHYVKVIVPVYGEGTGWNEPCGQHMEVVPLTRPFGITIPALFTARVLLDGQPVPNTTVEIERIRTDGTKALTPWHEKIVLQTDQNGQFSFVPNRTGWWCCHAKTEGAPLKGTDGQSKDLELGALLWFYADSQTESRKP